MAYDFDYFVIGAGSGGVRSARIAASLGARVGIAESTHYGGTCVNVGCIPKKIYSYAADYGTNFDDAKNYGWSNTPRFDWATLKQSKDNEIARLNGIYRTILSTNKVEAFDGYASFKDAHTITINGHDITAERFLIATGGMPQKPAIKGAEHALTSDDMFALETLPNKIIIMGAGYIALEFVHILHGMGCHVTIVHRGNHLLKGFDIDLQDHVLDEMKKQGIEFVLGQQVTEIQKTSVVLEDGTTLSADLVMAATGRIPNTKNLNLENAGLTADTKGFIPINADYQTAQDHIFAVGDVTNSPQLTPVAIAQGHSLANRLFNATPRYTNFDLIPTAVFSKPEIGTIGLTEQQAHKQGLNVEIFKTVFKPLRHTITKLDSKILYKMIVSKDTDVVLGLHICGTDSAELIQMAVVALNAGATKAHFDSTLPVHPTAAEELVLLREAAAPHSPESLAERG